MKNFGKKWLILPVLLLVGCGVNEPVADVVDLSNLYAQVCETADGPCTKMACSLVGDTYQCAEAIGNMGVKCGTVKTLDDVIGKYQICGMDDAEKLRIFNYAQNIAALSFDGTPAELKKKIEEETAKVEAGGESDFLGPFMASMGGAVVGGLIANALFNRPNAMPPRAPASGYSQPLKRDDLNKAKKKATDNQSKVSRSVKSTKDRVKKAAAKKVQKKTVKKTRKKRRGFSRRRR